MLIKTDNENWGTMVCVSCLLKLLKFTEPDLKFPWPSCSSPKDLWMLKKKKRIREIALNFIHKKNLKCKRRKK